MEAYVLANNKPSERSMKASILKHNLLPVFGDLPLDAIKMHLIEVFPWEVVVEPDEEEHLLVVVTAYPVEP